MSGSARVVLAIAASVALAVAVGCSDSGGDDPRAATGSAEQSTTSPPATSPTTSPPTTTGSELLASGVCPPLPSRARPDADRPRYRATVSADPETGMVTGSVATSFTPDVEIDEVVLRLWPNAPRPASAGTSLRVSELRVDGETVAVTQPDPTTLRAPLSAPAATGSTLEIEVDFELAVPASVRDRVSRDADSMRLGSFLPLLPWVPGEGWALDPPTALFAEATTSPTADFEVEVRVPEGYDVLATGVPDGRGRWSAAAVRDFAMSIGHFDQVTRTARAPEEVAVTVGVQEGLGVDPAPYAERVVAALEDFGTRFGPYPWPVLTLAITPGLRGGIEFPTHIMQGPDTLGRTTPHEVGHMWFYALVGNNQAAEPWLDEGLASYAEAVFESTMERFVALPVPAAAAGRVAEPLSYWADHGDDYYAGVYVQGAQAVNALGTREQVDCVLRHYVAAEAFGISDTEDFVRTVGALLPEAPQRLEAFGVGS